MKKRLLCFLFLIAARVSSAQDKVQEPENLITDRPGQTDAARTVGKGNIQLENGFYYQKENSQYRKEKEFHFPEASLRVGIIKKLELRLKAQLQQNLVSYKDKQFPRPDYNSGIGLSNIVLGTKFQLHDNAENGSALALQLEAKIPVESEVFRTRLVEPKVKLAVTKNISDSFYFLLNLGADIQDPGGDNLTFNPNPFYAFALYFTHQKLSVFGETFARRLVGDPFQHGFDFGIVYLLNPNLQLDTFAGLPLNEEAPDLFICTGISFRLPK